MIVAKSKRHENRNEEKKCKLLLSPQKWRKKQRSCLYIFLSDSILQSRQKNHANHLILTRTAAFFLLFDVQTELIIIIILLFQLICTRCLT